MNLSILLLVFLGGGIGSCARHLVNLTAMRAMGMGFPWGTITVNIIGSAIMGIIVEGAAQRWSLSQETRLFLTSGMLGGFTTFSAFSLDTVVLWEGGRHLLAVLYAVLSVTLSLAAIGLAIYGMRRVMG